MTAGETDEWLDKQLDIPKGKSMAGINGTSCMHMLEIIGGTCGGEPVKPRHRKKAEEIMIRIIAWWRDTPMKEKEKQIDAFNDEYNKMMCGAVGLDPNKSPGRAVPHVGEHP